MILRQFGESQVNRLKGALGSDATMAGLLVSVLIFALALGSRLPFRSETLQHWDSVNYALALEHFDVRLHQPQPPGYVLYVALGAVASALVGGPQLGYVVVSVLSSALAGLTLYALGKRMYGRTVGSIAAVFLLASPSFWFYGEIGMPHTLDAFLAILVVYLAQRVWSGEERVLVPLAVVLGLAGGVRQQTLVFLLPLVAYCVRGMKAASVARAILVWLAVTLAWLTPMVCFSGGIEGYRGALMGLGGRLLEGTSIFSTDSVASVTRNAVKLAKYSAYGWNIMSVPVLLCALRGSCRTTGARRDRWLVVLWVVPALLFYLLIHMGNPGLVFIYLPALMLVSARSLVGLVGGAKSALRSVVPAVALIIAIAAFQFVWLPEYPLGAEGWRCLTWQAVRNRDVQLQESVATIQRHFPVESTVVLASQWRHAAYYLPEYLVLGVPTVRIEGEAGSFGAVYLNCERQYTALRPPTEANRFLPDGLRWVVLFDQPALQWDQNTELDENPWVQGRGHAVRYRELGEGESLRFTLNGYRFDRDSAFAQSLFPERDPGRGETGL